MISVGENQIKAEMQLFKMLLTTANQSVPAQSLNSSVGLHKKSLFRVKTVQIPALLLSSGLWL
jgi:hypothetical protein